MKNLDNSAKYTYDEMFQRNIGIFTKEEQKKIKNLKVAIAGAGGLGGRLAYLLARLGVENICLCDPEEFEISNINRQFGCYTDTIGKNKASAVAKELLRINPNINLTIWEYGISEINAGEFIKGCDVVVDAIDFYAIPRSIELQEAARLQNKWVMTSQSAGSMASYIYMSPNGPHYGELFFENNKLSMTKVISTLFPVLPVEANDEMVDKVKIGAVCSFPSWSHVSVATYFLLDDLVNFYIKDRRNLLAAPSVAMLDLDKREYYIKNV